MPHMSKPDGALPGEAVCDLAPPHLQPWQHQWTMDWGQWNSPLLPLRLQPSAAPQRLGLWRAALPAALASALAWPSALTAPPWASAWASACSSAGGGTGIGHHEAMDWGQGMQRSCAGCCRSCCAPTAVAESSATPGQSHSRANSPAQVPHHGAVACGGSGFDMHSSPLGSCNP